MEDCSSSPLEGALRPQSLSSGGARRRPLRHPGGPKGLVEILRAEGLRVYGSQYREVQEGAGPDHETPLLKASRELRVDCAGSMDCKGGVEGRGMPRAS